MKILHIQNICIMEVEQFTGSMVQGFLNADHAEIP